MCTDWIELFVWIFLISPDLYICVFWKDVLYQPLTFPKKKSIWPKIHDTDYNVEHKKYMNDVALGTGLYSWPLLLQAQLYCSRSQYTAQTSQCVSFNVSMLWTRTLCNIFPKLPPQHHFHTQDCISQTVWADLKVTLVLMHRDNFMCIGYQQFIFWYLMRRDWVQIYQLYYHSKASYTSFQLGTF
jgi:hypothetical protein